jgi:hypothetical protein
MFQNLKRIPNPKYFWSQALQIRDSQLVFAKNIFIARVSFDPFYHL